MVKQFEYLQIITPASQLHFNRTIVDVMNDQGKNGWEAVSVVPHKAVNGHTVEKYEIFYKREKQPK